MNQRPRCERLWRDVGDDSPWYEKALFHALGTLEHGDDPDDALAKIEAALADRPQEIDPTIYEREAEAILANEPVRQPDLMAALEESLTPESIERRTKARAAFRDSQAPKEGTE